MSQSPYRTKYVDPDFRPNPKTETFCAVCQRDLKPGQKRRWGHFVNGGMEVVHPEDEAIYAAQEDKSGECGCWPLGLGCARKIGLEWTVEWEGPRP